MSDTVIDVQGLRRGYAGGFEAVRGVSFSRGAPGVLASGRELLPLSG
ncbi:hypothetical protein [Streptomyces sp. ISL-94]|nr:hypothetical protein [Streptomyces sp. ISL-94]MBT2478541.1 hypothetical protein [Streptomyces sp. ISL-94]